MIQTQWKFSQIKWSQWVPLITILVIGCYFSIATDGIFSEPRNLTNLARQVSVNCILAFGMTLIILLGAIDLSIGSVLALAAVAGALLQQSAGWGDHGWLGALATMAVVMSIASAIGVGTGSLVSRFKIPPFVVTLGILVMARGAALLVSNGSRIGPLSDSYRWLGKDFLSPLHSLLFIGAVVVLIIGSTFWNAKGSLTSKLTKSAVVLVGGWLALEVFYFHAGIPIPVLAMFLVFGAIYFLLEKTVLGRYIYAIGGNPEAARLCGIRVSWIIFVTYLIMGTLVGLSAIIESGRIDAGDPNAGQLYELDAIAAVVIGGTSLKGGVGHVTGTLLGALLIGVLNNGMSLLNVQTNAQMVIKGAIIIIAVLMDVVSKKESRI